MPKENYYDGLWDKIQDVYNGDATWSDVVDYRKENGVETTYDYVQRGSAMLGELLRAGYKLVPPSFDQQNNIDDEADVAYNATDNSYTYDKMISIVKGEKLTPELVMEKYGIDSNTFVCSSFSSSYRNTLKTDEYGVPICCYNVRLSVKPKCKTELTFDDIDEYFASKNWKCKSPMPKFEYDQSQESLEIDYTDDHIGLLAWRNECGDGKDYDIHIAEQRFKETFADILNRCKGKKYKVINFVTLGDILHIDNMSATTTKGTPQDTDGRITKIFAAGVDLMCECIDMLLELKCPIRYTYTCGNHDTFSGYALAKSLQVAYKNNPNIEFDISPNPQKIYRYGNTLVGYTHGDMKKKNLGEWMQKSFRKEFGECKFAEVHCGHLHSESVFEQSGVLVKHLPTICESSLWEHKEGYNSQKGVMCFVYHDELGLRDTWYTYL